MKHFLIATLLLYSGIIFSQSKIDKSKNELNSGSSSKPALTSASGVSNSSGSSHSGNNLSDEECSLGAKLVGWFFGCAYYALIGDLKHEEHLGNELTNYPYYNNVPGNYEWFKAKDSSIVKKNFRFDLQDNLLLSSAHLYGNHIQAKIRPFQYFYAQADYHQLFEKNAASGSTDQLALFYFNLGYDRLKFESVNFGWTVGAAYVGNEVKKAGFSFGVNTEVFIGHNISLLGSAKWSGINGKPVNAYELGGKYHVKRYFVSLGFEHLKIASPTYNFISAGGGIYLN